MLQKLFVSKKKIFTIYEEDNVILTPYLTRKKSKPLLLICYIYSGDKLKRKRERERESNE